MRMTYVMELELLSIVELVQRSSRGCFGILGCAAVPKWNCINLTHDDLEGYSRQGDLLETSTL